MPTRDRKQFYCTYSHKKWKIISKRNIKEEGIRQKNYFVPTPIQSVPTPIK
jgi:hypothetical protein